MVSWTWKRKPDGSFEGPPGTLLHKEGRKWFLRVDGKEKT